jgi:signal transduction histidine kinase/AraC-like DNA-binding protein
VHKVMARGHYDEVKATVISQLTGHDQPFDAILGVSDPLALACRDAAQELGLTHPETLIGGLNGDPLALAAIAEGQMTATVLTSAHLGAEMVDLACRTARGDPLPPHFRRTPLLVTADNVDQIIRQTMLAMAPLPSLLVGVNRAKEQRRLMQLQLSLEINQHVGIILDRQQLSHQIAELIREKYGYDRVQLFTWSDSDKTLVLNAADRNERIAIPLAEAGLLGQALEKNEPVFVPDIQRSTRSVPEPAYAQTRSRAVLPIRAAGVTIGLLDVHSRVPAYHTQQEVLALQVLADQLGIAMRNAELFSEAAEARLVAENADRLKTLLLANVSHEFRAPLNVILGYAQSALDQPRGPNQEVCPVPRKDVSYIYESGEHLLRLVNDLLDISRSEINELQLEPEMVEPRVLLEDVFENVAKIRSEATDVTWLLDLPADLPLVHADPVRLREVILNLLDNAQKFTQRGHVLLGAEVAPPHLHIWVEDTGVGIPVEQQGQIFEPFYTGQTPGSHSRGIGLGLAVARRLVALHGGFMSLDSRPGKGSTFHVYLPLPSLSGRKPDSIALHNEDAPQAILVVGGQTALSLSLTELSRREGYLLVPLRADDDLDTVLSSVRPMALAWDVTHRGHGDHLAMQRLRGHAQLSGLPFILYRGSEQANSSPSVGLTSILIKPPDQNTLIGLIDAMAPAEGPILIVDDDPQACDLYQRIVTKVLPGHPVRVASGGQAALAALREQAPGLVILDLVMPDVDGFAVLAALRRLPATRRVPVLVMSGHMLRSEDLNRLDHSRVVFHQKEILSEEETALSIRNALQGTNELPQATSMLVKQALAYMQQNYAQDLSRSDIAGAVGVSERYLTEIFHRELGLSPWDYLQRQRIAQARALLASTGLTVTDIGSRVGFADSAHFSRVFRDLVHVSPRAYRRLATSS